MDRKNIYNKGRAGHARNVNMYRLYRQKFKRWRFPLTAILALMLVFGVAPVVGEEFQASLLTVNEISNVANTNPYEARKLLLNELKSFTDDCQKFKMDECKTQGQSLISEFARPVSERDDLRQLIQNVSVFEEKFAGEVALNACQFDLGNAVIKAMPLQRDIEDFVRKYGYDLNSSELAGYSDNLRNGLQKLDFLVESCIERL